MEMQVNLVIVFRFWKAIFAAEFFALWEVSPVFTGLGVGWRPDHLTRH
jgi:hypothetical protein